jgi:flagellar motor switch protein FliG
MTSKQKAAALTVAIGVDSAAKIYKHLKEDEIEQLTLELATLQRLESETIEMILSEFHDMILAQKFIAEGGVDYANEILEKSMGAANARNVIDKVMMSIGNKAFDFMKKTDPKQLYTFIQNEHPQTIALVLAHATKFQASSVLGMLSSEKQAEVVERIATMDRTAPDTIKEVEAALQKKLSQIGVSGSEDIGGVKYTAELLNAIDRSMEKNIFETIGRRNPELVEDIRKLMFVFEDIIKIDEMNMQLIGREIDIKDLAPALKNAPEELKEHFFKSISKRNAEQVKEDIEYARNVRPRQIEEAQQRIVAKIREMEEANTIVISGSDD